ncbi:30S ribosomal protein S6 [Gehongia tenuis]|uniref:Small ribosomal subunit protein bS6 n=1 Tax=Gehongia tenuis TaxID=2763655 RepID=A0A926D626_9FIRM|nr:30S ribosomal protein S6 [Gehongia tenuis]MBC8532048.1 30S ribosomal protein S6 [Gehongia tenuis]
MNKYEVMYIIQSMDEEATKAMVEKFSKLVTDNGGTVDNIDEWGKRRLAYPINDLNEGYYVLMNFSSSPDFPTELERNFKITDGILRYMVIRVEE